MAAITKSAYNESKMVNLNQGQSITNSIRRRAALNTTLTFFLPVFEHCYEAVTVTFLLKLYKGCKNIKCYTFSTVETG